jgi:hypothetical protein
MRLREKNKPKEKKNNLKGTCHMKVENKGDLLKFGRNKFAHNRRQQHLIRIKEGCLDGKWNKN